MINLSNSVAPLDLSAVLGVFFDTVAVNDHDLSCFSQVWPVSCSLGAMIGFLTGLVAAPVWIHYHRKQLTYKCK